MNGPLVDLEEFRRLSLRVGTLLAAEPAAGDLTAATVGLGSEEIAALAPSSSLPVPGSRVVVAVGLRPLAVAGRTFTSCLVTVDGRVPVIAAEIPDGSPLS